MRIAAPHACHDAARVGHLNEASRSALRRGVCSTTGPDARLLWHHSLGGAQALGHSAQGRDPWPPERRTRTLPAGAAPLRTLRHETFRKTPSSSRDASPLASYFGKQNKTDRGA